MSRQLSRLLKRLGIEIGGLRNCAASALGAIGDSRVIVPLVEALGDSHEVMRSYIVSALKKIQAGEGGR